MQEGNILRTSDKQNPQVTKVEKEYLDEPIKVYNFEVEDFHTYYVSEKSILVHNGCGEAETTKTHFGKSSGHSEYESGSGKANFATDELLKAHYEKHGSEFKGAYNSPEEYLQGAQDVMKNGYRVKYTYKGEQRCGYVEFFGNNSKGQAKFAFVGTNNDGFITTFHTESGKSFWKMLNGTNIPVINPV